MSSFKVLITTVPFADRDAYPLSLMKENNIDYTINPLGRKVTEDELAEMVSDYDALIAGTEIISSKVMDCASRLKLISRVGIGLDGVDLLAAEQRGIQVSYTPDAPSPAVADLTLGLMLSLLRGIHKADALMHQGQWQRIFGRRLSEVQVGLIGMGRIGQKVLKQLLALGCNNIIVNDLVTYEEVVDISQVKFVDKETIYQQCDVVSLHIPLTLSTQNMIGEKELAMFKPDAVLVNTARGGIVNELALYHALNRKQLLAAAMDVFELEPYQGPLAELDNCLLTSHMGSMSIDCRTKMEIEATEEAVRFLLTGEQLSPVPDQEYQLRRS